MARNKNQKTAKRVVAATLLPFVTVLFAVKVVFALALVLTGTVIIAPAIMPFALLDFFVALVGWCTDAEHEFAAFGFGWRKEVKWALLSPFNVLDQWDWFCGLTRGVAETLTRLWRTAVNSQRKRRGD